MRNFIFTSKAAWTAPVVVIKVLRLDSALQLRDMSCDLALSGSSTIPKYVYVSHHFLWLFLFYFLLISSSSPVVPPNADLILEVHLLSAVDAPDVELLPPSERISLASRKRERGNFHYQRGDYAYAVNSYGIALQITEASSKGKKTKRFTVNEKLVCRCSYGTLWERGSVRCIMHLLANTVNCVNFSF